MKHYTIKSIKTKAALFSGHFPNFKTCLENAITKRITLAYADLRGHNLTNANLDDAILPYADFSHSNLTGANLSESYCKGANFKNTALFNTCFAYANLSYTSFQDASFGATDMAGSIIDGSNFSTLSAFTIDFGKTRQMKNCIFLAHDGTISTMSSPPIVIWGLNNTPCIITEHDTYLGHKQLNKNLILNQIIKICKNNLTDQSRIA